MKNLFFAMILVIAQAHNVCAEEAMAREEAPVNVEAIESLEAQEQTRIEVSAAEDGTLMISKTFRSNKRVVIITPELFDALAQAQLEAATCEATEDAPCAAPEVA